MLPYIKSAVAERRDVDIVEGPHSAVLLAWVAAAAPMALLPRDLGRQELQMQTISGEVHHVLHDAHGVSIAMAAPTALHPVSEKCWSGLGSCTWVTLTVVGYCKLLCFCRPGHARCSAAAGGSMSFASFTLPGFSVCLSTLAHSCAMAAALTGGGRSVLARCALCRTWVRSITGRGRWIPLGSSVMWS